VPATEELRVLLKTVADTSGATQTQQALKGVNETVKVSGEDMLRFAGALTGAELGLSLFATAGERIRETFGESIQTLREHERITRANSASYGVQAASFTQFAQKLSATTGFTSDAILEAALSARTLSQNYGLTIDQTQKLISVSADLARVRGIGIAEAFERVQSAIRGEAEASEYLGLTLNDTYIKNNAMNGSLKTTFEKMTDQQKAQVRYNELLKQTADFAGLAAGKTDSLDSAFRKSETSAHNLQIALGKLTAGPVIAGLNGLAHLANDLADAFDRLGKFKPPVLDVGVSALEGPARQQIAAQQEKLNAALREEARLRQLNAQLNPTVTAAQAKADRDILIAQQDAARKAADAANRRLLDLNTTFVPQKSADQDLARLAYLDQLDAAVRDLVLSQYQQTQLQRESVLLSAEEARIKLSLLPVQMQMAALQRDVTEQQILARQAALPATEALEDFRYQQQRDQLILNDRNQSREDRLAARRDLRALARAGPGIELSALDADRAVTLAGRNVTRVGLQGQLVDIQQQRALAPVQGAQQQNQLAQAIAAAVTQGQQQLVDNLIAANQGQAQVRLTVNVQLPDGSVATYDQLIDANGQAQQPPTIQQSGVRR